MLRKLKELKILKAIIGLAKDPQSTHNVFRIADTMVGFLNEEQLKERGDIVLKIPHFKELYEADYSPPLYDVAALTKYPAGTLGHAYGSFMVKHRFSPDWYPVRNGTDPLTYFRNRINKTHDIIHTMTGFDGSPIGEIGVQAFYLGQAPDTPIPCAIIASAFLRAIGATGLERERLMQSLSEGYEMGRRTKPVLFRKWEDDWSADIAELRGTLGMSRAA